MFHSWHHPVSTTIFCLLDLLIRGIALRQDHFCVWFRLAQLPTETARVFFLSHSLKKKQLFLTFSYFLYLFNARKTFLYFTFSQSRKILSYFTKLSAILKCRRKHFVVMTSIVYLSSNRS